jgi:hypothetical protein
LPRTPNSQDDWDNEPLPVRKDRRTKYATVIAATAAKWDRGLRSCRPSSYRASTALLEDGNLPVGLIPIAKFSSAKYRMKPGDRLVVVTDGVTEAEDAEGEFFGTERLEVCCVGGLDGIVHAVGNFRGATPLSDDCTVTEVTYRG